MSLFKLPTSAADLVSANQGVANAGWRQITATRDVSGNNFHRGKMQFRFETGGTTWWVPPKSYMRIRCSIRVVRAAAGVPLPVLSSQDIAPAMGLAANLFKTVEMQMNGTTIERLGERLPAVDALKTRMGKSFAFLDSIGGSTNFWDDDFQRRREMIASDGYAISKAVYEPDYLAPALTPVQAGFNVLNTIQYVAATQIVTFAAAPLPDILIGPMALRVGDIIESNDAATTDMRIVKLLNDLQALVEPIGGLGGSANFGPTVNYTVRKLKHQSRNESVGAHVFEIVWQPPLGLFDRTHAIPPGATWNLEFDPETETDLQRNAIESAVTERLQLTNPTVANQFEFRVDQMYLFIYTVDGKRFDNGSWFLDIQKVRIQDQAMPQASNSLVQQNFQVNRKTNALTLMFQDQEAGVSSLRMRTKFKIRAGIFPAAGGVSSVRGQDLLLQRFWLQYNNATKPNPDYDGLFVERIGDSDGDTTNLMMHRYVDSLMNAGAFHTEGGAESFDQWLRRGPFYHFLWPKDALEEDERVNANYQFSRPFDLLQGGAVPFHRVLLANWWREAFHIVHKDGRVTKTSLEKL